MKQEPTQPDPLAWRCLVLELMRRAIIDYLYPSNMNLRQGDYESARDFLFDDSVRLDWGGRTISPRSLLDAVDIDIDWLRGKITAKKLTIKPGQTVPIRKESLI